MEQTELRRRWTELSINIQQGNSWGEKLCQWTKSSYLEMKLDYFNYAEFVLNYG